MTFAQLIDGQLRSFDFSVKKHPGTGFVKKSRQSSRVINETSSSQRGVNNNIRGTPHQL